ncbi:MAG: CHASE2 domain-containing protein [Cyclobacteriaceae bacterium]|jgi:CHASE2 domain-containing sensor protein|nr:CHASE2 domain-containing protein [Cyclobacteriaceae bacterium]
MKRFWFQCLNITIFVFTMMWLVNKLTDLKMFNAFDPFSQALKDFEMTDYAFSKLREDPKVDERIVIVNLGELSRREVAAQLYIINRYKPRVIGIDSYFDCEGRLRDLENCPALADTLGNVLLANAIEEAGNVVLVSKLLQTTKKANDPEAIDIYDSLEFSDLNFSMYAKHGFANLVTNADYQEDVKQCRSFVPRYDVNGEEQLAFAVQLCMQYDPEKTKRFLARTKEEEIINYRGNVEMQDVRLKTIHDKAISTTNYPGMFFALDVDQLLREDFDSSLLKDKIVIMGFMGKQFGDPAWDDKYYTPLNKKVAGRANPDMFGVVIHANIVAMILNEDYIGELTDWTQYMIAIIICFFTISLFIIVDQRLPMWFDTLSVTIQVIQILAISGLIVYAFVNWSMKLELSLTLAASALVGPCYDIYKGFQNQILAWNDKRRLTKQPAEV